MFEPLFRSRTPASLSRRRALLVLALGLALILGPSWSGAPSWAQDAPPPSPTDSEEEGEEGEVHSWAVAPAGSTSAAQPGNRPNFSYELAPGATVRDAVTVHNYSNVPLTFRLYATDAFNTEDGGFDVLPGDEAPKDVGTWVTLAQEHLTIPAGAQVTVPFELTVPRDASPGDHVGAVLASSKVGGTGPDGRVVALDRRTGTRLYVRVAGPLAPELAVTGLRVTYHAALDPTAGRATVSYRVENRGNVRMGGEQQVSVSGPFGLARTRAQPQRLPELLPGESLAVSAELDGVLATGLATARVDLDPAPVDAGEAPGTLTRRSRTVALPVVVLVAAVLLASVLLSRRAYLRHRRVGLAAQGT